MVSFDELSEKLDVIEAEMKSLGLTVATQAEAIKVDSAFGGAQMSFEQWLGAVFIPHVRQAIANGALPDSSGVGVAAVRNFDGRDEMDRLTSLLCNFDYAVKGSAGPT